MVEKLYLAPGDAALERLRQREPFATILAYDAIVRSAALEGALRSLSNTGVHIIRLANPLRAPLTLERILIQLAGFQDEMSHGEDTDSVLRAVLSQLQAGRDRMVISIEQAETLHPMALLLLAGFGVEFAAILVRDKPLVVAPAAPIATPGFATESTATIVTPPIAAPAYKRL